MTQEEIYKKYQKQVLNFILQRVEKIEDAEEILQETFLSAFQALPFYSAKASFLTWLCAIAHHEIADFYRKRKIKTIVFSLFPKLEYLADKALGPEIEFEKNEVKRKIAKALMLLVEGYRQVLRLKYIEGFSVHEIAQKLNETEKTIESRLTRARKAFARIYVAVDQGS